MKLLIIGLVGMVLTFCVIFGFPSSDAVVSDPVEPAVDEVRAAAEAESREAPGKRTRPPTPSGEVESGDPPPQKAPEKGADEESAPMEPIVGGYWERFFEEHDLIWGPFPGVYDGYRFPWVSDDIQRFIDDPLFNPRGLELNPNQRAELQLIVTEAKKEINAARGAIFKEYSQIAMEIAKAGGGVKPCRSSMAASSPPSQIGRDNVSNI